jgi:hypothetical protein
MAFTGDWLFQMVFHTNRLYKFTSFRSTILLFLAVLHPVYIAMVCLSSAAAKNQWFRFLNRYYTLDAELTQVLLFN